MKKFLLLCTAICNLGGLMASNPEATSLAQKRTTVMRINEENPNYCLVVTEMYFREDTIPENKTDYEYDSDRILSAMYQYEMTDTGWFCNYYVLYDHLYLPNDTTNIAYSHEWDYEADWKPTKGHKTQVITNGNTVIEQSWETSGGDTTQWVKESKQETTYDAEGRPISSINYMAENDQFVPTNSYEHAYNEDGEQVLNVSYVWMDNAWKPFDKDEVIVTDTSYFRGSYYHDDNYETFVLLNSEYELYDANGNKLLYIWGADNDRIYLKEEYIYVGGLLFSKSVYREANYYPYNLELTEQSYYQHDAHNRIIEEKSFRYSLGSIYAGFRTVNTYVSGTSNLISGTMLYDSLSYDDQWYPRESHEYTYNSNGRTILEYGYGYDRDNSTWYNANKYEAAYTDDDMEIFSASYYWDSDWNMWHGDYKQETEFNEDGVAVSNISYIMFDGDSVWVPERATVRSFDIYGNFLGEGWYVRNKETGVLENMGKQLFVYVCGDIPTPAQPVIVEPGHDFVTFAWLSYEDAHTYTLTVLSASQTDTIAIMNFNSFGQLISETTFATPSRSAASLSSGSVYTCLIEGLETATYYHFILEVKDEQDQVTHIEQGNFHTDGYTTAVEQIGSDIPNSRKMLHNNTLLIQFGERWYNAQGQMVH